jgi:hypothetical protein
LADPDLEAFGGDLRSDLHAERGGLRACGCDDRHDLLGRDQRHGARHRLLDALDRLVCFCVDLFEILTQAIQEAAHLFRHPGHGEVVVRLGRIRRCLLVAVVAESIDRLAGLLRSDARRIRAGPVGALEQLDALLVLALGNRLAALRIRMRPNGTHDGGRELAARHARRGAGRYHLTPRS